MTLPVFLAFHLIYGTLMGFVLFPRMRVEGEVLGPPLLITLLPVALVTAPVGAVLLRYAGGWFLHGALVGNGSVAYERFHFGLLLLVGFGAGLLTIAGMFNVVVFMSRGHPRWARLPIFLGLLTTAAVAIADGGGIITVAGTHGRALWQHPVGLLSLAVVLVLSAWVWVARVRFATVGSRP